MCTIILAWIYMCESHVCLVTYRVQKKALNSLVLENKSCNNGCELNQIYILFKGKKYS